MSLGGIFIVYLRLDWRLFLSLTTSSVNNIAKNIVYSGSKTNIKMTMIDGKILYEDGNYQIGISPEEIYAKANESEEATTNA